MNHGRCQHGKLAPRYQGAVGALVAAYTEGVLECPLLSPGEPIESYFDALDNEDIEQIKTLVPGFAAAVDENKLSWQECQMVIKTAVFTAF